MATRQSDTVDKTLALEAVAKRRRGEIPTDREQRALNRVEKRQEEDWKDGKEKHRKLVFAAWRVHGSPTDIRER